MNLLVLAGNVGGEPRLNSVQTQNGPLSVLNFSLAVQTSKKDPATGKYGTLWVDCSLWGTRADSLAQYIQKGSKLSVSGEPGVETYQGQNGMMAKMTCRVNELTLQGSAQAQQAPQQAPQQAARQPAQQAYNQAPQQQAFNQTPQQAPQQRPPMEPPIDFDEEIPF